MLGGRNALGLALAAAAALAGGAAPARAGVHAYVPGTGGSVVSRIDLASNEALPITVGDVPIGVGASADGSRVVVSNSASGSVSIIDGVTGAVVATVPVGGSPAGVGVTRDGAKAYVADQGTGGVTVVDVVGGVVLDTLPVQGFASAVAMSPSGHRAYVTTSLTAGTMAVIDTTTDVVVADVLVSVVSPTAGVVASPDGTRVYVGLDSALAVVDATTNLLLDDVSFPCDAGCGSLADLTITPDGSRVYGGLQYDSSVVAVDPATLAFTKIPSSSPFSSPMGVDVSPDGATLYVINGGSGTIDLIDVASSTIRATLIALVPFPAALGEFIAGPPPVVPPPPPPVLDAAALTCQKALLDSFKPFAASVHHLVGGCLQRLQKDYASGAATSATTAACLRDLDPASGSSRLARARATAKQRILARCATTTPAALGRPCDPEAESPSAVADCILDRQLAAVTMLLEDEVAQPCALLALLGLDAAFPALCN
jgi:YVTN family beta-propeller protein